MTDKSYLIRFKPPEIGCSWVVATRAEFQGDHLVLLNSSDKLVALYLTDVVESWTEFVPIQDHVSHLQ